MGAATTTRPKLSKEIDYNGEEKLIPVIKARAITLAHDLKKLLMTDGLLLRLRKHLINARRGGMVEHIEDPFATIWEKLAGHSTGFVINLCHQ